MYAFPTPHSRNSIRVIHTCSGHPRIPPHHHTPLPPAALCNSTHNHTTRSAIRAQSFASRVAVCVCVCVCAFPPSFRPPGARTLGLVVVGSSLRDCGVSGGGGGVGSGTLIHGLLIDLWLFLDISFVAYRMHKHTYTHTFVLAKGARSHTHIHTYTSSHM